MSGRRKAGRDGELFTPASDGPASVLEFAQRVAEDVEAVFRADPAARSRVEVLLTYPGLHAVWMHRAAHALWKRGLVLAPRLLAHANRFVTGVEIHPGATLGRRVFIDHGMGVVIGETSIVGDDCLLYKGSVLGGTSLSRGPRHPRLGRGVVVGTNACVLGRVDIGTGARIGSGSVVVRDVPDGATVVGVPARMVERHDPSVASDLNHGNLPDPIAQVVRVLAEKIERLEARMDGSRSSDAPAAPREHAEARAIRLALAPPKKRRAARKASRVPPPPTPAVPTRVPASSRGRAPSASRRHPLSLRSQRKLQSPARKNPPR